MYVTSYQNRSKRVEKEQVHILQKAKGRLDFGLFLFWTFFFFGNGRNKHPNATNIQRAIYHYDLFGYIYLISQKAELLMTRRQHEEKPLKGTFFPKMSSLSSYSLFSVWLVLLASPLHPCVLRARLARFFVRVR